MIITLTEWLQKTYKNCTLGSYLRPTVHCNDGFELDIQASEFHNCSPKKRLPYGGYKTLEIVSTSKPEDILNSYCGRNKNDNFYYNNIPIFIINDIINKHGGIIYFEKDDEYPQIIMNVEFESILSYENNMFDHCTCDGFTFKINGKDIPIDFGTYSYIDYKNILKEENNKKEILFKSNMICGLGGLESIGNKYILDVYDDEYSLLGLDRKYITAMYLSNLTSIEDIRIDYGYDTECLSEKILSIEFIDGETSKSYIVPKSIIDDYNNKGEK